MHILIFVTVLPLANDMTHNLEGVEDEIEIGDFGDACTSTQYVEG